MRGSAAAIGDALNRDLVEPIAIALGKTHAPVDDRGRLGQCAPQAADENHLQLGVDELEYIESLAAVAMMQKSPRPGKRVDQLTSIAEQQAGRHDPLEERVIRPEQLRERMASSGRLKWRDRNPRFGRREWMDARVDGDPSVTAFAIDAPMLVDDLEATRDGAGCLARAEKKNAATVQSEMKQRQHFLLCPRLKVDEQVAAGDEIDARERRVLDDVVLGEDDHLANVWDDLISVALSDEIAREAIGRYSCHRLFAVGGAGSLLQRAAVNVGRKDFDRPLAQLLHQVGKQDREGVRLFPRRAARDPQPQRSVTRLALQELWKDLFFEHLERLLVSEEPGDFDEQIPIEHVELVPFRLQTPDVLPMSREWARASRRSMRRVTVLGL